MLQCSVRQALFMRLVATAVACLQLACDLFQGSLFSTACKPHMQQFAVSVIPVVVNSDNKQTNKTKELCNS